LASYKIFDGNVKMKVGIAPDNWLFWSCLFFREEKMSKLWNWIGYELNSLTVHINFLNLLVGLGLSLKVDY